jgi:hypothetical protein
VTTAPQGSITPVATAPRPIDPGVRIGHVQLWDRPFEEWPRDPEGHAAMALDAELDVDALLAEAPAA